MLNYKEYGNGEPLIILHGLLGMLDNWHSFSKKLSKEYWIISVDQRNHGKSFHDSHFDYDVLAEDLFNFLEQKHIPRCHLLGHSMGGKTVLNFINTYGEMIDKSIIVDIAPKKYKPGHELIFNSLLKIALEGIQNRKSVQEFLMNELNELSTVLFLMKNLSRSSDGKYTWKANIESLYNNYQNITQSVYPQEPLGQDILFVKGEHSNYISPEDQIEIMQYYPEAKIEIIQSAGHWIHADQPEELLKTVKNFLKD